MKHTIIANKYLPLRLPIVSTALCYIILDLYGAPGWLWGVMGTLFLIIWIATIWRAVDSKQGEPWREKLND